MQVSGMAFTVLRKRSAQRGVGTCPSAMLSWGLWWLLCLKAPWSHRGEEQMTCLYCEGLESHIMYKGSQVLHRGMKGWRYWLWEMWWVERLQVVPWSLSHLDFSLLPAGSPQNGLFSLGKVCGVGVWPQKCCWGLCYSRVDPFSGSEGLMFVLSSVTAYYRLWFMKALKTVSTPN